MAVSVFVLTFIRCEIEASHKSVCGWHCDALLELNHVNENPESLIDTPEGQVFMHLSSHLISIVAHTVK